MGSRGQGADELPTLSVGAWPILSRCDRRLAIWLAPDRPRSAPLDDRFRLKNAVVEAVRDAHARSVEGACDVADVLETEPPSHLEPEEASRFADALDAYGDAVAGRAGTLRPADDSLSRPSRSQRFRLTGRPDLVFDLPDGGIEIRRLLLSPRPRGAIEAAPTASSFGPAMRLLLRAAGEFRVLSLYLVAPGGVEEMTVEEASASAFGYAVNAKVDAVLAATAPQPTPGWYCNDCPSILRCPAIPQAPPREVVNAW